MCFLSSLALSLFLFLSFFSLVQLPLFFCPLITAPLPSSPDSLFLSVFASNGPAALLTPSPLIDGQRDLPLSRLLSPLRPVITWRLFRCPTVSAHHTNSRVVLYTQACTHPSTTGTWVFLLFAEIPVKRNQARLLTVLKAKGKG